MYIVGLMGEGSNGGEIKHGFIVDMTGDMTGKGKAYLWIILYARVITN